MGHSQSYDLRNPEYPENFDGSVKGVRRISKEHEGASQFYLNGGSDYREDELRERIRKEQLRKREEELNSLRIKENDTKETIIDAYRSTSSPQPAIFSEFNYYDHLRQHSPSHPDTYEKLHRQSEVNNGDVHPLNRTSSSKPVDYPPPIPFTGRVSPLPRHREVENCPLPRLIPPMSPPPRYDTVPDEMETSRIFAEKRMIVNVEAEEHKWSSCSKNLENLHRNEELEKEDGFVRPVQSSYGDGKKEGCNVEYCTHVEVPDDPIRVLPDNENDKENHLKIVVDHEKRKLEGIEPFEEKLHYHPYFPTINLDRRPIVGFYDKLV